MTYRDVDELVHSCSLDVAEIGGESGSGRGSGIALEELGEIMGVTKERARQVEFVASKHLAPILAAKGLSPERMVEMSGCKYCGAIDHETMKCKVRLSDMAPVEPTEPPKEG